MIGNPAMADAMREESLDERRLVLPTGVFDADGRAHRCVRVRELTGADEEALFERGKPGNAWRVSAFLASAIESVEGLEAGVDAAFAADLQLGDRDYLLLRLRQMDLGDAVHQVMRCPACLERVDVDLSISELPVRRLDRPQAVYQADIAGTAMQLRLPTGADQAAIETLAMANPAAANTRLFARIVLDVDGQGAPDEETVRAWPLAMRSQLVAWLEDHAPGPELFLELVCPHCRADMSYAFDLDAFFLPSA
ncbi:hypothetical protein WQ53_08430 [Pseudoxanthomonas suwonensis]|uniref:Uncharacterized protein n=2 Tax=Pseudoxanthomonas suwonensis TaxID=314722 RepID=A0A0E3UNA7_9GAMM|nr:hypothetical protein WQ53_08430 [Pseudoxanthomonas suwonensis]